MPALRLEMSLLRHVVAVDRERDQLVQNDGAADCLARAAVRTWDEGLERDRLLVVGQDCRPASGHRRQDSDCCKRCNCKNSHIRPLCFATVPYCLFRKRWPDADRGTGCLSQYDWSMTYSIAATTVSGALLTI